MEGLNVQFGRFVVTDPDFWRGIDFHGLGLVPSDALIRQNDIGSGAISFEANAPAQDVWQNSGRLGPLKKFIQETGCYWPALEALARRLVAFDFCPGDGITGSVIEQAPNPDSRVSLTDDVDSFGLRRIQMNWQLCDADLRTIRVLSIQSAKEFARLNLARVQLAPSILDTNLEIPVSGYGHHMGTTRMSADRRFGVVDENCRVHGVQNLYLAGSSVFPRCGGRNPTLTVVLLALRLADFLNGRA
jgi:choline dehydrogenase-like flavoprotein